MPKNTQASSEISAKNTKTQILEAYEQVVQQLQNQAEQDPQKKQKAVEEKDTLTRAKKTSEHVIISNLADLKINLAKQIDLLSEQLVGEFNRLSDLQKAISIEQEHLQNIYGIKESAHTLSALMITQEEATKKHHLEMQESIAAFEQEMAEKRQLWEKEKSNWNQQQQDLQTELERKRSREEEEYTYRLEVSRQKNEDAYRAKQAILEEEMSVQVKALEQRELSIKEKEDEFKRLQKAVEAIPATIAKAEEDARQQATQTLKTQFKFETELNTKVAEGEHKLAQQRINSLETKIEEQQNLINTLVVKADDATEQVKAIACQALEASSDRFSRASQKSVDMKQDLSKSAAA